jgi:hypothetical protein
MNKNVILNVILKKKEYSLLFIKIEGSNTKRKYSREGDAKTLFTIDLVPDLMEFKDSKESISFKLPEVIHEYISEINIAVLTFVSDFENKKVNSQFSVQPIVTKLQKVCYYAFSMLLCF